MAARKSTRLLMWLAALGVLLALLVIGGVTLFMWEGGPSSIASTPSGWLKLELQGELLDGPRAGGLTFDPEDTPLSVSELAAVVRRAQDDPEITGVFVDLDAPELSMATAQELRGALVSLTASGKPCVAWSKTYENLSYYLASACGEVHLHPEGVPLVLGLNVTTTYLADTLNKLGVKADYERVGAYKSAVETFEELAPSPASVEMYNSMIDDLYAALTEDIAAGRGRSVEEIRALIDDPPITATDAKDRGLVDQLTYRDELVDRLKEDGDGTTAKAYAKGLRADWRGAEHTIAVLHLSGNVVDGDSGGGGLGGGGGNIGDRTVVKALDELAEDDDIAAVVLRIDSPGGSALASDVIWRAVRQLDEKKPVVASMGSTAASGGYYIAMAAREIVAQPGTITGSIGVFAGKFALTELYKKVGLTTWTTRRGALAGLLRSPDAFTDAERAKLRQRIEAFYTTFITKAAEGRGKTPEEIDAVAQGRVWTGRQAHGVGLVDQLGGVDLAVAQAASLAGLPADAEIGRSLLPKPQLFWEALSESLENASAPTVQVSLPDAFGPELSLAVEQAFALEQMSSRGGLLALDPVIVTVR
ncbi:signal peptide peptidase SppA [Myxococcota bacterium]|nr:signal peptide peptidase SppA [Myxococcota bacterium]